jgi:hypothetical protein
MRSVLKRMGWWRHSSAAFRRGCAPQCNAEGSRSRLDPTVCTIPAGHQGGLLRTASSSSTISYNLAETLRRNRLHRLRLHPAAMFADMTRRRHILTVFCLVAMALLCKLERNCPKSCSTKIRVPEACASSHYWSRELPALGHTVRLMPAVYVNPDVKRRL